MTAPVPAGGPASEQVASALISLGLLQPRVTPHQAVAAAAQLGVQAASKLLFRHKVASIACRAMADAGIEDAELTGAINAAARPMRQRWASADAVIDLIDRIAARHGIRWLSMKGISVRRLYPPSRRRDVGDLDLLVDSVRDAWILARDLRAAGYTYLDNELPWFKRDVGTGRLYGQVRLVAPRRDRLSVDIHAGPYSIRHCGLMRLERSADLPAGAGVHIDDDLCAVVANAAGDFFVTAKLVNDLVLILKQDIDIGYVRSTLDRGGLLPFLAACLALVEELCELRPEQRDRLERLRARLDPEPRPSLVAVDASLRCQVTVAHARVVAARLPDPGLADEIAVSAREAYGSAHPLRVVADGCAVSHLPAELNNWTCVRLVPVALAAAGDPGGVEAVDLGESIACEYLDPEIARVTYRAGDLIIAGGDTFIPTVGFALSRQLVRAAAARFT